MEQSEARYASDTSAILQAIAGAAVAALATLGIGATAYCLVVPGGLVARVFERNLAGGLAAILALLMVGLCAWLTRDFISSGSKYRYAEILVYGFAAAGAFHAFQFLAEGAP